MADRQYVGKTVNFSNTHSEAIQQLRQHIKEELGVELGFAECIVIAVKFYLKAKGVQPKGE